MRLNAAAQVAGLLNSVLDRRELFSRDSWAKWIGEPPTGRPYFTDPEIEYYAEQGIENLSHRDLVRLNFLLICEALESRDGIGSGIEESWSYNLDRYISRWTNVLTEVGIAEALVFDRNPSGKPSVLLTADYEASDRPSGYLVEADPKPLKDETDRTIQRVIHPCFGGVFEAQASACFGLLAN